MGQGPVAAWLMVWLQLAAKWVMVQCHDTYVGLCIGEKQHVPFFTPRFTLTPPENTQTHTHLSSHQNSTDSISHGSVFFSSTGGCASPLEYYSPHLSACQQTTSPAPWSSQFPCFPPSPTWGILFLQYDASTLKLNKKVKNASYHLIGVFETDTPKTNRITSIITILSQNTTGASLSSTEFWPVKMINWKREALLHVGKHHNWRLKQGYTPKKPMFVQLCQKATVFIWSRV